MPLAADARVGQPSKQVEQCLAVIRERVEFPGHLRGKFCGVPRQFRVRQPYMQVVDAMKRLMQQGESKRAAPPSVRHDIACGTVGGISRQPDMFNVFASALKVSCQIGWQQIHP